ncbi:MAG TPA: tetratricopeptide repeat protein [Pyrinomonadaceae bacterium]|nr:tetratricopeptide repeat protein [Pyrinomonadaceae bacterium]
MECRSSLKFATLLSFLLAAVFALNGCTNPEKAKAQHLARGESFLQEGRYQEASLEFRNAIQIDDRFAAAHWGLARAYEGLQRAQEMINELARTVELDPNNLDARLKLGTMYLAASRIRSDYIAQAERMAKEILQRDPKHIEGHILMAGVFFAQHDRDKAFAELNQAIEIDPNRVESYLSMARFYVRIDDHAKAEETYKRAISINSNSSVAYSEYGRYLMQADRPVEAEAALLKAIEVEPSNRNSRLMLAGFYLVNKQLDKAEAAYKAVADLDKDKPEGQSVLADFYASVQRTDDALRIYQDVVAKSPDFKQGRYQLADLLWTKGDKQGAMAQIDELLKKDRNDREALVLRGKMRANSDQANDVKAGIEDLKEVLKQEPNSRNGLFYMAQSHLNLGSYDESRKFASELERNYPDDVRGKFIQVLISQWSGDPKATVRLSSELLDRLNKTTPDRDVPARLLGEIRVKALMVRGTANAQLRNFTAARQDLTTARDYAPTFTDVYVNLAALSVAEGKYDDAVTFYENALSHAAADFKALNGLIGLYALRKEPYKGHTKLDAVLATYPNDPQLHFLKAQVYSYEQNAQAAESELRKALELDPNYLMAYSALATLFINTKQEERAIAEYKRILELRPDDSTAYTMIGMLYDARKDYNAAAENYRKALVLNPNSVLAANNLAWLYAVQGIGNIDEAVRLAQRVVQQNPQVAGFVDTLGWVYYKKGLNEVAIEQLQNAVRIDEAAANRNKVSPSPTYRYHLAMALKAKGDAEGAKRELGIALRLADRAPFPYADEARKALATL